MQVFKFNYLYLLWSDQKLRDYEPLLSKLSLQFLIDRRVTVNKVLLHKCIEEFQNSSFILYLQKILCNF